MGYEFEQRVLKRKKMSGKYFKKGSSTLAIREAQTKTLKSISPQSEWMLRARSAEVLNPKVFSLRDRINSGTHSSCGGYVTPVQASQYSNKEWEMIRELHL